MTPSPFLVVALFVSFLSGTASFMASRPRVFHDDPGVMSRHPLPGSSVIQRPRYDQRTRVVLRAFPFPGTSDKELTKLVVDDELWGLAIALGDIVRDSIWECAKKFQFRPDQIAVEVDKRVKKELAKMMGKDEFHIMDFIFNLNKIAKENVRKIAGDNEAEYTQMTNKIENDVKSFLQKFTGKQDPDGKDIEDAVEDRARKRIGEFLGMERFSLENVAKEIDKKRNEFWKEKLGEFWADRANDVNNMATKVITGKDTYVY